jgi:hypothetical protein
MNRFECWQVKFDRYSYYPLVTVPDGTTLNLIEGAAREVMVEKFGIAADDSLEVQSVTRLQEVWTI